MVISYSDCFKDGRVLSKELDDPCQNTCSGVTSSEEDTNDIVSDLLVCEILVSHERTKQVMGFCISLPSGC